MILASHGIIGSSIVQFTPQSAADAFYARVTDAGGSLTSTEESAILDLVTDLVEYGLWDKMKAIYPMVGASAAACAQNLKSSGFTGTFTVTGWGFSSNGAQGNGTSAYMDTGLNPAAQSISIESFHFSIYLRTNIEGANVDIGAEQTPAGTFILPRLNNEVYARLGNNYSPFTTITDSRGFFQVIRLSPTNTKYFVNNTKKADSAINLPNYPNQNIYLGALNYNGNPLLYSNRENAFASIGDGLTDDEALDFYNAVQAFQTTLSRQV